MTTTIIIIGSFFTLALIFAGIKAISILVSRENEVNKYASKDSKKTEEDSDYITIKKQLLYELVARNQRLNTVLERAVTNYQRSENEINFILNADSANNKDYDNVRTNVFDYENIASN